MKRWPLRWKIALYAAGFGVIATIAGAATTWTLMHRSEIATFDKRLTVDAQELFRDVENFGAGLKNNEQAVREIFVPLALRNRLVEIHGADGAILYRSPTLSEPIRDDGIDKIHT